jgi:MFS transporter, ACS family, hexuronate transporter
MRRSAPEHYPRVVLALMMWAQFVVPLMLFSVGALAPLLRDALRLSREQLGTLTALYHAGAALAAMPVGWLADRWGVRDILIIVQAVNGLALVAIPWLHTYETILPNMFLGGVAFSSIVVLTNKALYDWFPRERRATAIGAKYFAMSVSGIVAGAAAPMLALWVGWQHVFALMGGLILASALSHLLLYRDRPTDGSGAAPPLVSSGRRSLCGDRRFWRLVTAGFLFAGVQFSVTTYLALFLHETWGFSLPIAASLLALAQGAAAASRVSSGWVSDRWLKGERKRLLQGMGLLAMGSLVILLLMPPGTPYVVLAAVIAVLGMSGMGWGGVYQTLAVELAGQEAAGLGTGLATTFIQVGSMVSPPLFGYLVDVTGTYTVSWSMLVLWLLLGIGLLGRIRSPRPLV